MTIKKSSQVTIVLTRKEAELLSDILWDYYDVKEYGFNLEKLPNGKYSDYACHSATDEMSAELIDHIIDIVLAT